MLLNTSELFSADPLAEATSYLEQFKKLGNIRQEIQDSVVNFKVAIGCIEEGKLNKGKKEGNVTVPTASETLCGTFLTNLNTKSTGTDRVRVSYSNYDEVYNKELGKLETLLKPGILDKLTKQEINVCNDDYTVAEFAVVLKTVMYSEIAKIKNSNDEKSKELAPDKPTYSGKTKENLLFDNEEKTNIVAKLLNVQGKDLPDLRVNKAKILIVLFMQADKDLTYRSRTLDEDIKDLVIALRKTGLTSDLNQNISDEIIGRNKITGATTSLGRLGSPIIKDKDTFFTKLMEDRVTEGRAYCSNILHFAALGKSSELVGFIVKKYVEVYPNKIDKDSPEESSKEQDESYRDVRKYINKSVYSQTDVMVHHNVYTAITKEDILPCELKRANGMKSELIERAQAQTALELVLPEFDRNANEESLKIAKILLANGARYNEDLVDSRDKPKLRWESITEDKPKYSSTIFKDFLEVGGLENPALIDLKKEILRILIDKTANRESNKNNRVERYASLIDQALKYDSKAWCEYIVVDLSKTTSRDNVGQRSSVLSYLSDYDGMYRRDKDHNRDKAYNYKGQSSKGLGAAIARIFGSYKPVSKSVKKHCQEFIDEYGTWEKTLAFIGPYLPSDISLWYENNKVPKTFENISDSDWKRLYNDYRVYSVFHMAGELFRDTDDDRNRLRKNMPQGVIDAVKLIDLGKISVEEVINFILHALDAEDNDAWVKYRFNNYFRDTNSVLSSYEEKTRNNGTKYFRTLSDVMLDDEGYYIIYYNQDGSVKSSSENYKLKFCKMCDTPEKKRLQIWLNMIMREKKDRLIERAEKKLQNL